MLDLNLNKIPEREDNPADEQKRRLLASPGLGFVFTQVVSLGSIVDSRG